MSPRTEKQYEQIRSEKRDLIMQTAMKLFADKGYENTSISQIAKEAGISKGLMYNYFENKEELLKAIMDTAIDDMMALWNPNTDHILEADELEYFIIESFKHLKHNRLYWKLYFQVMMQEKGFAYVKVRLEELYKPLMVMMVRYFKNAGFENPEMEAMLFGMMMDGISLDYALNPEMIPIDSVQDELIKRYCKINM